MADECKAVPPEERVFNCKRSRDTDKDWNCDHVKFEDTTAAAGDTTVDLRTKEWTIRDQRRTGACVGFAVAGVLRYYLAAYRGDHPMSNLLSTRFVWMASKETDQWTAQPTTFIESAGTFVKAALDVVRKYGCPLEEDVQMSGKLWSGPRAALYLRASTRKIGSYVRMRNCDEVRRWLQTRGPLVTRLDVDSAFRRVGSDGKLDTYTREGPAGHAVAIVGWVKLKDDSDDQGRFIIRNSWGTSWGHDGFAYATEAYVKDSGMDVEAYGLLM